ncbi:DNA polymerase IV [Cycloclasticus sp. 46_120_T64]|nr:DNA polymerase IV [Cycloclasticus sp. 46_120_T64]
MDAFFASVEQRDNQKLQGLPVVVGGQPDSRGVVAACSYEARQFGIHSAMPSSRAHRLCPQAVFVAPRIEAYRAVSVIIQQIFRRYASEVEPLSLDEAYLDVSDSEMFAGSATHIAQAIKAEILEETQLVASAGVSYNKFLAKIASDMDKPNGLYVIKPTQGERFVADLAVAKFHGVGPVTAAKMHRLGIQTGRDLRAKSKQQLQAAFGKSAEYFYNIARAIDLRPVCSVRRRKSLGKETTFTTDIADINVLREQLIELSDKLWQRLERDDLQAKTFTLKVKYANFRQISRALSVAQTIKQPSEMHALLLELLLRVELGQQAVRLLGVTASGFAEQGLADNRGRQLELFDVSDKL